MTDSTLLQRRRLRRELRERRDALSPGQRQRAAATLTARLAAGGLLRAGARVGLYVSAGSEIDTSALLALARQRGCRSYLPRISDYQHHRLQFCRDGRGELRPNRFGIREPPAGATIDARWLDLILMPLLGFDATGNRIGTGGGYYDRLLWWRASGIDRGGPRLIGLAFQCQQLERLPALPHDVPLDAAITESGWLNFRRGSGA